jgi:hypothetical protein
VTEGSKQADSILLAEKGEIAAQPVENGVL